jgi:large subunit ribosomal protein L15
VSELNLSNLKPAAARKDRKRIGRGLGSGKGRYAGRGLKGQKARAGSHKMRPGFEGGQTPLYMRVGKQRGATSKDAMPIGPFRTFTQPVNVGALDRFDAGAVITPEALKAAGLVRSLRRDVKILGRGEIEKKLAVSAHAFSASAREKIEKAGGSVIFLRGEPVEKPRRSRKKKKPSGAPEAAAAAAEETAEPDEAADAEPEDASEAAPEGEG